MEASKAGGQRKALVVVDLQADFKPGGALGVAAVTPDLIEATAAHIVGGDWTAVAVTMDMHPENHSSFTAQGGPWPPHCVRGTPGCKLDPTIASAAMAFNEAKGYTKTGLDPVLMVVHKGQFADTEHYSGFGTRGKWTALGPYLMRNGIEEVYVCGVATEYCVKATAEDALRFGFKVHVVSGLCASIDAEAGAKVFEELKAAGAIMV